MFLPCVPSFRCYPFCGFKRKNAKIFVVHRLTSLSVFNYAPYFSYQIPLVMGGLKVYRCYYRTLGQCQGLISVQIVLALV